MKISELRKAGCALKRSGMAEMVITEVHCFDGSYKSAMELCGKLSVIAKMATCDVYWSEQVRRGIIKQEFQAEKILEQENV